MCKRRLRVWHPTIEDIQVLADPTIEGTIHWFGGKKHGHLIAADLPARTHDLNYDRILPREERHKAALRLMSWCTFRMPPELGALLTAPSDRCAIPSTTDEDLVLLASRHQNAHGLKAWLIGQLHCWVEEQHLNDYQGVVGTFLMDLALPIIIFLLDSFLPQLNPTERCVNTLDIMAAPVHYAAQLMTFTPLREDPDFAYYAFTNTGGNVMVMTAKYADQCANYLDYV